VHFAGLVSRNFFMFRATFLPSVTHILQSASVHFLMKVVYINALITFGPKNAPTINYSIVPDEPLFFLDVTFIWYSLIFVSFFIIISCYFTQNPSVVRSSPLAAFSACKTTISSCVPWIEVILGVVHLSPS